MQAWMNFDYKKFSNHDWVIACDEVEFFQCFCNKCMYRVTFAATYNKINVGVPDVVVDYPMGFIVGNNGIYNQQYSDQHTFFPPIKYMNVFFEMNSCDELIIKNIIE